MSAFSGRSPSFWLLLLCTSLLLDIVLAAEYRVDDVASGITYSGGWQQGAGCTGCFAKPNKDNAYGGTWHDSTRGSGAANYFEYTFTGDAVSVYGIFINIVARNYTFTTNVDLTLSIDGQLVDTFKHQPEDTNSYAYNQLSVSVNGLPARPHTLRVELQPSSNFLFDYLVYNTPDVTGSTSSSSSSRSSSSSTSSSTTQSSTSTSTSTSRRSSFSTLGPVTLADDPVTTPLPTQANSNSDPQTTTTKSSNLGVIIGAVIGGFGALLLLLFLIFFFCFRRKQRQIRQQFEQNHKEAYDSNPVFDGSQSQPLVSMTGFGPNYSSNGMASYHNSGAHGGQMNDMVNPFVPGNGTVVVPPLSTIERLGENGVDYSNLNSKQRMMLDHTQPYTSLQQPTYPPQPLRQSNVPIWVRNLSDDGDMSSHTGALSDDSSPGGLRSFVPSRRQRQSESNHGGARRGPRTISASETSGYLETESDSTSNANSRGAYSGIVGRSSMEKGYATSISSPSNQGHTVPLQHLSQSFHPLQNHPYANPDSYRKPESGISANATNPSAFSHNQTQAYAQLVEQKERRTREEQEAVDELAFIHSAGTNEDSHRLSMGTTAYTYTDGGLVDRRAPSAPPPYIRSPPLPDAPVPSVDVSVLNGGVPPVPPLREKAGWV